MELFIDLLKLLVAGMIGVFTQVVIARYSKSRSQQAGEERSLDAQTENSIAKTAREIADGSTVAIANLIRSVEFQRQEITALQTKNDALESEIEQIRKSREETHKERDGLRVECVTLKTAIEEIKSKSIQESDELKAKVKSELIDSKQVRADNVVFQKRILELETESASKEQRVTKLENTALTLAEYIDALDKGLPPPKMNGMLDSVRKMKLTREQQDLLKAGK